MRLNAGEGREELAKIDVNEIRKIRA